MSVVGKVGLDCINFLGKAAASVAKKSSRGTASAIKAAAKRPAFKIRQTGLFGTDRTLFPFAKYHPLETAAGKLREDGMILCHMTEHLPTPEGKILSIFDALGETRNSVHFSVNHPVMEHQFQGAWSKRPYAILMPMKGALRQEGNHFAGGIAPDFFSRGSVTMPKGTVIVRHGKNLPEGKLRVIDASTIDRFKKLKGIKIVEVPTEDVYSSTRTVMKKLGYEIRDSKDSALWGEIQSKVHENTKKFNAFLKSKGMRPMFHTNTPNGNFDMCLIDIKALAGLDKSWTITVDGKVLYDYKKAILDKLPEIKDFAKKENLPLDINIDAVIEIVKNSATPKEAATALKEKLKLDISLRDYAPGMKEKIDKVKHLDSPIFELHNFFRSSISEEFNTLRMEYLKNPTEENFKKAMDYAFDELIRTRETEVVKVLTQKEYPEMMKIMGL